ncbi:hypothetical protein D9M68_352110 [compost metagenome]
MAGRGTAGGGQAQLFLGHRVVVGPPALGQHHHLGEQAVADIAGRTFAAEGGAIAADGESAFALGVQGVSASGARCQQVDLVAPCVAGDIADIVHRLHAVDLEADMTIRDLGIGMQFAHQVIIVPLGIGVGQRGQEVLHIHLQAVTLRYPQHQRTRTLVRAQGHGARRRHTADMQRDLVAVHHVAAQGEHHAVDVLRTEAVEHQRLVEGHHVCHQRPCAINGRLHLPGSDGCPQQEGSAEQHGKPQCCGTMGGGAAGRVGPVHLG